MNNEKIKLIMAKCFEVDDKLILDITSQKTLSSWDSLAHLNFIIEMELEFNLDFEPEEISKMDSFMNVITILSNKMK